MKELLLQYAGYNVWANNRIIEAMLKLQEGAVDQEMISSFPTIRATVYHTWSAEHIWLQRLQKVENPEWLAPTFRGTFTEACELWQKASAGLHDYIIALDEAKLTAEITYHDRRNNAHSTPAFQILHHVFNHSTYHRGQLVTMLRQAGATEIPATDFIGHVWKI